MMDQVLKIDDCSLQINQIASQIIIMCITGSPDTLDKNMISDYYHRNMRVWASKTSMKHLANLK